MPVFSDSLLPPAIPPMPSFGQSASAGAAGGPPPVPSFDPAAFLPPSVDELERVEQEMERRVVEYEQQKQAEVDELRAAYDKLDGMYKDLVRTNESLEADLAVRSPPRPPPPFPLRGAGACLCGCCGLPADGIASCAGCFVCDFRAEMQGRASSPVFNFRAGCSGCAGSASEPGAATATTCPAASAASAATATAAATPARSSCRVWRERTRRSAGIHPQPHEQTEVGRRSLRSRTAAEGGRR